MNYKAKLPSFDLFAPSSEVACGFEGANGIHRPLFVGCSLLRRLLTD